jgi:hypothetical protein
MGVYYGKVKEGENSFFYHLTDFCQNEWYDICSDLLTQILFLL